jgi:hypothetical protein
MSYVFEDKDKTGKEQYGLMRPRIIDPFPGFQDGHSRI